MGKSIVRYFLLLCVLLLSGHSQLSAHAFGNGTYDSSSKLPREHACSHIDQEGQALVTDFAPSLWEKQIFTIEATEEKEEDDAGSGSISFKRHLKGSDYFAAVFCAQVRGYFFSYKRQILAFSVDLSYPSSDHRRYLIFQVFRI
jgi:hypothetical protein